MKPKYYRIFIFIFQSLNCCKVFEPSKSIIMNFLMTNCPLAVELLFTLFLPTKCSNKFINKKVKIPTNCLYLEFNLDRHKLRENGFDSYRLANLQKFYVFSFPCIPNSQLFHLLEKCSSKKRKVHRKNIQNFIKN